MTKQSNEVKLDTTNIPGHPELVAYDTYSGKEFVRRQVRYLPHNYPQDGFPLEIDPATGYLFDAELNQPFSYSVRDDILSVVRQEVGWTPDNPQGEFPWPTNYRKRPQEREISR
jgi:hypothetical protein